MVPQIAADLLVDVKTAALLSTAFTLPYALTQPVLGTIADFFGKTRLMNMSLLIVSITALICAVATSFELVFGMRVAAGLVAGGVFPVAMALVGDLVPIHQRQVMIGRLLAVGLTGNVLGAAIAGVIGDLFGWRGIFVITGAFGLIVTVAAFYILRSFPVPKPRPHVQSPGSEGELPRHLCRSARQILFRLGVLRRHLHPRHLSVCGDPAAWSVVRRAPRSPVL